MTGQGSVRPDLTRVAIAVGVLLLLLVGGGNLWATYSQNSSLKHQIQQSSKLVDAKLCKSLGELAALKPPAGDAASNPSRAYEQSQHDILAGLGPDMDCPRR